MFRVIGKSHTKRLKSPASMTKRQSTTLTPALEQLKQEMRSVQGADHPIPILKQLRQSPLYNDAWNACKTSLRGAADKEIAHYQQQAKAAADAYTTCYALDSVIRLSEGYDLRWVARSSSPTTGAADSASTTAQRFLEQIRPAHQKKLVEDFHKSWRNNSEVRQSAILSALAPDAIARLDLTGSKAHEVIARDWDDIPPDQLLNVAELLALVDYVNSNTGTFNAVNGAAMAHAYYGDKVLSGLMQVFSDALNGAIVKLCAHPYFGKANIVAYKGINLNNPSGQFRLGALEAAVGTGKIVAFPNVLSATSDPEKSYAAEKYFNGYTIECQITMRKAFDADPFHDVMTMGEKEVIAPAGQRFVVVEKQAIDVFQMASGRNEEVTRYLLEPASGPSG